MKARHARHAGSRRHAAVRPAAALLAGLLIATAAQATTCESLRTQIEARIAAAGVARFSVTVVEADAPAPGRAVGSCDMGRRKIVYLQAPAASTSSAAGSEPPMLTECRDGRISLGGDCRN